MPWLNIFLGTFVFIIVCLTAYQYVRSSILFLCEKSAKIFHITTKRSYERNAWYGLNNSGNPPKLYYSGSSLSSEGFIHCCRYKDIGSILERFPDDVEKILLEIDAGKISSPVKYESGDKKGTLFPHIYGPIDKDAITAIYKIEKGDDENSPKLSPATDIVK